MRTRRRIDADEERQMQEFVDRIGPPPIPVVRVYRITEDGKQTRIDEADLESVDEVYLRERFGPGSYLLRTVRSNGTYGPSKVVRIASRVSTSW